MTNEKIKENSVKPLNVDISTGLFARFEKQRRERGQIKKVAAEASLRLWISLPDEIQARLINKALDSDSFIELVEHIVDERIGSGTKAGKALAARQNKKPSRKG